MKRIMSCEEEKEVVEDEVQVHGEVAENDVQFCEEENVENDVQLCEEVVEDDVQFRHEERTHKADTNEEEVVDDDVQFCYEERMPKADTNREVVINVCDFTNEKRRQNADTNCVMARSSLFNKLLMMLKCLKRALKLRSHWAYN